MFSHVVIFWTDPANPNAADELLAGMEKYLRPIPGVLHFHAGKMASSHRPVVDQTYQVALNLVFPDKRTQEDRRDSRPQGELEVACPHRDGLRDRPAEAEPSQTQVATKESLNNVTEFSAAHVVAVAAGRL